MKIEDLMHFIKKIPRTFLWSGIGFAIVVIFMLVFYYQINSELVATEVSNIKLNANQQQAAINGSIKDHRLNLQSMARSVQLMIKNQPATAEYLQNLEKSLGINTVIAANTLGRGRLSSQIVVDVSEHEAYLEALKGKTYATSPFKSKFSGKNVIAVATPMVVEKTGEITGVIIVEYSLYYINKTLTTLVDEADEKGFSVIMDNKSNIIVSTNYKDEFMLPLNQAKYADGVTFDEFMADMAERKKEGGGVISYSNGETHILEYRPINLRDWSVIVVSEDVSNTLIRSISEGIKYLLVIIMLSFFIFLTATLYLKRKGMQDIEKVAFYDELTGLPNLVNFKETVKALLKEYPDKKFAMQKMDIQNFKAVNEMFGHDIGDKVIQKLAETIKSIKVETFCCARVGADEFLMFAADGYLEQSDEARDAYEKHFKSLLPELKDHEFNFRYGRYFLEEDDNDIMEIINKTSMAHHMAKVINDKKTYEYDDSFKKRILRMAEITNKRKHAIENNEFKLYLQPKINIFTEKIYGAEALVRWIESDGKMIYPNEFIPLFEKNGFIVNIDMHILKRACRQIKLWLQAGYKVVPISVNFSRMHLQNPYFVNELKAVCDSYGDIRQYIEVELTESAATENVDDLARILDELHEAGFSIAIDDFGAGYSSLGMLKNFTVDCLKLDKSFFDENHEDTRGETVVRGIINIAKSLDMKIVAEGIETAEQIEFLKSIACEIVQGYFYAKPMPISEFEQSYMGDYDNASE